MSKLVTAVLLVLVDWNSSKKLKPEFFTVTKSRAENIQHPRQVGENDERSLFYRDILKHTSVYRLKNNAQTSSRAV